MEKPIINFKSYTIDEYIYHRINQKDITKSNPPMNTQVKSATTKNLSMGKLTISITIKNAPHDLKLVVSGLFLLNDKDYGKEEILNALIINGTAIMFPYLRSMVSVLTNLGTDPGIILPTINTNNLLKNNK